MKSSVFDAYSLEHFSAAGWPVARRMLQAGYPETPAAFWDAGFRRMQEVPPGPSDAKIGSMLRQGDTVLGIALLIPGGEGRRPGVRRINASSWTILPEARHCALWMARQGIDDHEAVYTALTPIPSAARLLQRVGFRVVSHQTILGLTPQLSRLPSTKARLLKDASALSALASSPLAAALEDHRRLGCMVCALDTGDTLIPLVFRTRRRWRLFPVAELIYTPSQAVVAEHIRAIARQLLASGYLMLEFDAHEDLDLPFPCTKLFRRRFARGAYDRRGIDYLYSEQVYLHR